jgi:hypothetical protein
MGTSTTLAMTAGAYSWDYGFLTLQGSFGSPPSTAVTAESERGDSAIMVASAANLKPGQRIQIQVREDKAQSLKPRLTASSLAGTASMLVAVSRVLPSSCRGGKVSLPD